MNIASTASFQPVPLISTYAATKSFVLHFSEAIAEEVAGSGGERDGVVPGRNAYGVLGSRQNGGFKVVQKRRRDDGERCS